MMNFPVEVIGCAVEPYAAETSKSAEELGFVLARQAREMAGVGREEITSVHNSTMDLFDGITISNGLLQPAAGGYERDCTRIQNGGAFALISACAAIASGGSTVAVVTSADAVRTDTRAVSVFSRHPFLEQPLQFSALTSYALLARAILHARDFSPGQVARVASRNYQAGACNADAHVREPYSTEEVLGSKTLASPLRNLDVSLHSSAGGAAVLLSTTSRARTSRAPAISVRGIGMSTSSGRFEHQVELTAVRQAARQAYRMAGIEDPAQAIDVVELDAPFSIYELALYEALGLGRADQVEAAGSTGDGPTLNPSGGTLCTNARNSGGLFRVAQAVRHLQSLPPDRPATALVHDSDVSLGMGGDSHAVLILERALPGGE